MNFCVGDLTQISRLIPIFVQSNFAVFITDETMTGAKRRFSKTCPCIFLRLHCAERFNVRPHFLFDLKFKTVESCKTSNWNNLHIEFVKLE
jgi:hypothetical protein